jgi:hypothetical protein
MLSRTGNSAVSSARAFSLIWGEVIDASLASRLAMVRESARIRVSGG